MKRTHTCTAYIAKSKIGSNRENRSYNQIKMCMCVEFSGWNSHPFLHDSIFYFEIWAIFLFSFFPFSFSNASGNGYFFLFLSHSSYSFCNMKSHVKMIRVFLCGWKACFCATSSVEVGTSICGVFVILILKAWNESRKSHKQFDKVQCKNKYHMNKVRQRWQHMALVGI